MVLGWAFVILIIYGLFFFDPKNDRVYLGSKSLKRLYRQEYGEPAEFDPESISAGLSSNVRVWLPDADPG